MEKVVEGDRFVVLRDVTVKGLTHWNAPATFGFEATIPKGTVMVAYHDGAEDAEGFGCVPERYAEMEAALVPEEDRLADKYGGYSFTVQDALNPSWHRNADVRYLPNRPVVVPIPSNANAPRLNGTPQMQTSQVIAGLRQITKEPEAPRGVTNAPAVIVEPVRG